MDGSRSTPFPFEVAREMPTYEYVCSKCDEHLEVYQTFSEEPLKRHSGCGGKLTKVLGAGFSEYLSGRGTTYGTLHAAAGVRINLGEHYGARFEVRARSIDPFSQSTTDFTFGFMKRLSPN